MTAPRNSDGNFLLCELRRIRARARLFVTEIDSVGLALKDGLVTPEGAVAWLAEIDPQLFDLIGAP
jgi:hypothetical protein